MITQTAVAGIIIALFSSVAGAQAPATTSTVEAKRIAIYDSRAVAVAYCGSALHRKEIQRATELHRLGKASGDKAKMQQAERAMSEAQDRLHRQGFGSHPVDDILNQIPDEVVRIRKAAGAAELFSKWDQASLSRYPNAERVDVTDQLVEALKPTDKQRKYIKDLAKHTPIPSQELEKHLGQEHGKGI